MCISYKSQSINNRFTDYQLLNLKHFASNDSLNN